MIKKWFLAALVVVLVGALASPASARPYKSAIFFKTAYAPGTSVGWWESQQVMVADQTSKARGTWARYEWRGQKQGWAKVSLSSWASFGSAGVKPGQLRVAGDKTTPAGVYPIKSAFGVGSPGTAIEYRTVTNCSYWSDSVPDYNRWREDCARPTGEHLIQYVDRGLYTQTMVVGFNWDTPIVSGPGSGSAIFVHYSTGSTAGCVGLNSRDELVSAIRWLQPSKNPTIVITQ